MSIFYIFQLVILTIFAFGWASFSTQGVYRLSNNKPWIGKKPFCTECGHELYFRDYIPFLSYFINKGKCRFCKKPYSYGRVYMILEFLIIFYFFLNFLHHGFSEIFLLNIGFVISATIWSIVFWHKKISNANMLIAMFFFIALKRVFLDQEIFLLFYYSLFAVFLAISLRHLYYYLIKDSKKAFDYLEYKEEGRFAGESFLIVKLSIIAGPVIANFFHIFLIFLAISIFMFLIRNLRISLSVIANILTILMII